MEDLPARGTTQEAGSWREHAAPTQAVQRWRAPCHPQQVWFISMAIATGLGAAPGMPQLPLIPARWEHRLGGAWRARLLLGVPVYLAGLAINGVAKQQMILTCISSRDEIAHSGMTWRRRRSSSISDGSTGLLPLCTSGIFQFTRNPVYLAALCLSTGAGLLANSACFVAASTVPFFVYCQLVLCPAEEGLLLQLYGEEYRRYCSAVPRWLRLLPGT